MTIPIKKEYQDPEQIKKFAEQIKETLIEDIL
jgi:hypothetical protein